MKFGYTIVYVDSVPQTLAFYKEAFGFETRFLHEAGEYGELDTGETTLAFASHGMGGLNLKGQYQKTSSDTLPFGIEIAFVTDDVGAAYEKAVSVGAIGLKPPAEKPWGQIVAYVRAREGTLIEICSPVAA